METDHTRRLVNLISLVAYTEGNKCSLREPYRTEGGIVLATDESVAAHEMCMYYAGAVRYVQSGGREGGEDFAELADFTLPFVTNASANAEQLLGTILISTLHLFDKTNSQVLGRKWLDDAVDACWSAKLATAPERYGLDE